MNDTIHTPMTVNLKKDEVLCIAESNNYDLYLVHSGKLLVFANEGTKVTPLAYIEEGEYIGELSFFDNGPRSAHVICTEDCSLIKISTEIKSQIPAWMIAVATSMSKKIRHYDHLVSSKGFRTKKGDTIAPLSIDEQRHYFQQVEDFKKS